MKERAGVLIVDDERGMRDLLSEELGAQGYRVAAAADGNEALEKLREGKFAVVISDINMPRMGGLKLLGEVKRIDPGVEVILSTGYGTVEMAVSAMKSGAYDFIQKPFNLDELLALVEKALEKGEVKAMLAVYESSKAVFSSLKLDELLPIIARLAAQVLKADATAVLLPGPQGRLSVTAAVGLEDTARRDACLALSNRAAAGAATEGPVIILPPAPDAIAAAIVCPLVVKEEALGLLIACRYSPRKELFTAADLRPATIFGAQIAQAIGNANLYLELEKHLQDIQEMQGRLIQSEKLAAVGQLAAGVAHEINNPLSSIMGFTSLLLQDGQLSLEQREDLSSILHESQRCRDIVQGLLQFSRKREAKKEPVRLQSLLERTLLLARHSLCLAGIEVVNNIPDDLPPILADPSQLQQVFLNLITNAQQALEGRSGGGLSITSCQDGDRVVLRFSDNGPGIAPKDLGRIFDPFFTTKEVGKGTGLGLSICQGIIAQNGGTISAESPAGAGAAFVMTFPVERPS